MSTSVTRLQRMKGGLLKVIFPLAINGDLTCSAIAADTGCTVWSVNKRASFQRRQIMTIQSFLVNCEGPLKYARCRLLLPYYQQNIMMSPQEHQHKNLLHKTTCLSYRTPVRQPLEPLAPAESLPSTVFKRLVTNHSCTWSHYGRATYISDLSTIRRLLACQ